MRRPFFVFLTMIARAKRTNKYQHSVNEPYVRVARAKYFEKVRTNR